MANDMTTTEANEIRDLFHWAYTTYQNRINELRDLQNSYDNVIDPVNWPTQSELSIPVLFVMVEQAMPSAMNMLLSNNLKIDIIADDGGPSDMEMENVERLIRDSIRSKLNLARTGMLSIRDVFKVGVGYGSVEEKIVKVPDEYITRIFADGELVASQSNQVGYRTAMQESYRYISPGQVIPLPDGADPETVSGYFMLESMTEQEIRDWYELNKNDPNVSGSAEAIIAEAKQRHYHSELSYYTIMEEIDGRIMKVALDNRFPTMVPILKYYSPDRQIWLANGRSIIWKVTDDEYGLVGPLCKASAWPDGNRWFPMSVPEATKHTSYGVNLFTNAMMDLLTRYLFLQRVYDKSAMGQKGLPRDGMSDIEVFGDPSKAVAYLQPGQFPSDLLNVGGVLNAWNGYASGQPLDWQGTGGSAMKAGTKEFQELLQSQMAREHLANTQLKTGWLNTVIEKDIALLQVLLDDEGRRVPIEVIRGNRKRRAYIRVRPESLRYQYGFSLSLGGRWGEGNSDFRTRLEKAKAMIELGGEKHVRIREALAYIADDEQVADQIMRSREEVAERDRQEQEERKAQLDASRQQIESATQLNRARAAGQQPGPGPAGSRFTGQTPDQVAPEEAQIQ